MVNRTEYCTSYINSLYINSFSSWLLTCNISLLCCVQVFLVFCGKKNHSFGDGSNRWDFPVKIPRPGICWRALAVASRHSAPAKMVYLVLNDPTSERWNFFAGKMTFLKVKYWRIYKWSTHWSTKTCCLFCLLQGKEMVRRDNKGTTPSCFCRQE